MAGSLGRGVATFYTFLPMPPETPSQVNNSADPAAQPSSDEPIVGIDLGTTNSLVAYCDARGPRILPDGGGRAILPSVVRFDPVTGEPIAIGREARLHAIEFPRDTIFSIKRLMGRGIADVHTELAYLPCKVVEGPNNTARIAIGEHVLSPQQISAIILRTLRRQAEAALGVPVRKAVITVPAYFDDAQRQATRDAGRIAGLEVMRIVNEPTAAALAYGLGAHKGEHDETVAVYDLGGGTFDVSILRLQSSGQGVVDQVLATAGDTHLGGDDVDRMIVQIMQKRIREQLGDGVHFGAQALQAMRNAAERAKIELSDRQTFTIELDLGEGRTTTQTFTRDDLEQMAEPWVSRTIDCCRQAMRAAGVESVDRVIMVGGSTRMPLVRRHVGEFFGIEPYTALDPDQVVALGAAVQASILAGVNRDMLLLDVIPLSLGIETMGGAVAKLIVSNTTIPARATEMFSTYVDGQTNVKIHIVQGERELVQDCRSLGQFDLRGIPPMPAGLPKIEVTFLVDANGILNVSAVEKRSETQASIQIVPNHGLTREEVAQMEAASFAHAREDMTAHRLIDLRNQARLDMRAIQRQLDKVGDELDTDYREDIERKMAAVKQFVESDAPDADAFAQALTAMDHATVRLAEIAIKHALRE